MNINSSKKIVIIRPKTSLKMFVLLSFYRILLDLSYGLIISKLFAYTGLTNNFGIQSAIISWLVLILLFCFAYKYIYDSSSISNIIICALFCLSVVPFTTLILFGVIHSTFIAENVIFWIVLLVSHQLIIFKQNKANGLRLSRKFKFIGNKQLEVVTIVLFIATLYVSWKYTHFRIHFDLIDVYGIREEASYYNLPRVLEYLLSWSHYLLAVLLAYFLINKEMIWAILCIVSQILNFGIDGSKVSLFLTIIVIVICIPVDFSLKKMNFYIIMSCIFILAIGLAQYMLTENYVIASLFARRTLILPAYLENCYFDFFSTNTPDFFRSGLLRRIGFSSPYSIGISKMIGYTYFNSSKMSANNGLISDALANWGVVGIFIYPIVLSFTLKLIDKSTMGLNAKLYFVVALYIAIALVNSFYLTTMLTHGLLFLIVVLFSIKREEFGESCVYSR